MDSLSPAGGQLFRTDSGSRLLLIDDDEKRCRLLRDYLEPPGYSVDAVHDGADGLLRARQGGYSAVILDRDSKPRCA